MLAARFSAVRHGLVVERDAAVAALAAPQDLDSRAPGEWSEAAREADRLDGGDRAAELILAGAVHLADHVDLVAAGLEQLDGYDRVRDVLLDPLNDLGLDCLRRSPGGGDLPDEWKGDGSVGLYQRLPIELQLAPDRNSNQISGIE